MRHRAPYLLPILLVAAVAASALAPAPAAAADAWDTLAAVRGKLAGAGVRATFTQTYVPAGFSSGESEKGQVALADDCLRWDYREPFPKSFLLCGDTAHYWTPGDATGRRYAVDRAEEPGLDLLLLDVEQLRRRYKASERQGQGGRIAVDLEPVQPMEALSAATLTIDPRNDRLIGIAYRDREGNRTRFYLSGYKPLGKPGATFQPPRNVRWEEGAPGR